MKKVVIFGATEFEKRLKYYIDVYSEDCVVAFCVDGAYKKNDYFCDCPVIAFEEIDIYLDNNEVLFLIGIGYKELNALREKKYMAFKNKGFVGYNLIHKKAFIDESATIGESNIFLANAYIDYKTQIGNCNIFENGVAVSHNCIIQDYNYFSPGVTLGGKVVVNNRCFFGINSTIRSATRIQDMVVVGASAYVDRNVEANLVIVPSRSYMLDKDSLEINLLYKGEKTWKR